MRELGKRSKKSWIIQVITIIVAGSFLFCYTYFGFDSGNDILDDVIFMFGYTFPMIFVVGLYGSNSGIFTYVILLIPSIYFSTADTFYLTFHLVLLYVVELCRKKRFLKTVGKAVITSIIAGFFMNYVFVFINYLVAQSDFSSALSIVLEEEMLEVGIQVFLGLMVLYLIYRFTPEKIANMFPVGNFHNHEKNGQYSEYMKRRPKHRLGHQIMALLSIEALVLGIAAALVANALIPELGEVVMNRQAEGAVSGGAVSPGGVNASVFFKPDQKPDDKDGPDFMIGAGPDVVTAAASGIAAADGQGGVPAVSGAAANGAPPEIVDDMIRDRQLHMFEKFINRTRLAVFGDSEAANMFVLNSEGIAFDIKLILFLFDIIMPFVALINFILQRRTVQPITVMAEIMDDFADDSIEKRLNAAEELGQLEVNTKDEVGQLYGSMLYTVNEVIEYIQRVEEEQKLKEDLRVAKKASEAKSNFLSNVSHEIRTPINAVLGMDEMILRESNDPRIRKYATDIKNSGRTLVSLINDLLDFSRIEAGKLEIIPVEYEMSSTLNDLVNMISVKAEEKGLKFNVDVDETIPHLLIGDEIRIKQCIINILNNAVKYTETGSVSMRVGYKKEDEKHVAVDVSVTDTGIGMKEEDLKRLFTPFERIEENRNRNIEGAGLGMSIVKQLLDMMGSSLEVKSIYGEGSEFRFSVSQEVISWEPMGNFSEMYERSIESRDAYEAIFQAPDAKILVVDDTKMNLTVITGLLEPTRVRIKTAMSGKEALELVKNEHFDLIFLDQRMPGMDGIETLAAMKELPEPGITGTPVVALTANAISGARERFIRAGFDDYLTKPIDSKKLENTMASMLPDDKVLRPGDEGYIKEPDPENGYTGTSGSSGTGAAAFEPVSVDLTEGRHEPVNEYLKQFILIDGINYDAAIANCMKEAILADAVEDFASAAKTGPDEIEKYFNELDTKNYTVKVHALKSSARLIGALELSAQAAHLEMCGDDENWDEIHDLTPKLLADYRLLGEKLQAIFESPGETDERPEIDIPVLTEAYAGIREYVDAFDYDSADAIIEMLKEYKIPDAEKEKFEMICDMLMKLDHDGLLDSLG